MVDPDSRGELSSHVSGSRIKFAHRTTLLFVDSKPVRAAGRSTIAANISFAPGELLRLPRSESGLFSHDDRTEDTT